MIYDQTIISDKFLDDVEANVGYGSGAWDMVEPKAIIAAAVRFWELRYKEQVEAQTPRVI